MEPNAARNATVTDRMGRGVVGLLALAMFINYVDRGNLATAAPLIKGELNLTNVQIGLLLSAFFWTYTPGLLFAGWLAEKINAYRTIAIGLAIWSLATVSSGLATGFFMLLVLRLLLGLGESASFPCSAKLLAKHLPTHRLGAANGLISVGLALGSAFGTFAGGSLMASMGWRPVFILFGLASILWLVPWFRATRSLSARVDASCDGVAPSFFTILKQRPAWGACLGHFSYNYAFYFVISWLPLYLVKSQGFTIAQMAKIGGIVYVVFAISAHVTGWISDKWMRAGASDTLVRKVFCTIAHVGIAACMLLCALGGPAAAVFGLLLAGACFGLNSTTIYAIGQTLGGPKAGGKWIAIQGCIGNIAGIVAPIITGFVADRTGQFTFAFLIAGLLSLVGIIGWDLVIKRVAPVQWVAADQ